MGLGRIRDRAGLLAAALPCAGASHRRAAVLLRERGYKVERIVQVAPDAIVYVNHTGVLRTAWLRLDEEKLRVVVEDGLPDHPPWER